VTATDTEVYIAGSVYPSEVGGGPVPIGVFVRAYNSEGALLWTWRPEPGNGGMAAWWALAVHRSDVYLGGIADDQDAMVAKLSAPSDGDVTVAEPASPSVSAPTATESFLGVLPWVLGIAGGGGLVVLVVRQRRQGRAYGS
jgi:hypothetical protein